MAQRLVRPNLPRHILRYAMIAPACGTQSAVNRMPSELYHLSEEAGIRLFKPRPLKVGSEPLVWAIDAEHVSNYLLPRDCPRVTFSAGRDSSSDDGERFLLGTAASRVVAIESGWLERVRSTLLYRYTFSAGGFELHDVTAGYHVSHAAVVPTSEQPVGDLLQALLDSGVELRVLPALWDLRERVIHSTLAFSIIRMRNASQPERGFDAYHSLHA